MSRSTDSLDVAPGVLPGGPPFTAQTAGTTLRFGAQNPAHPWWMIADRIIEALVGFSEPLLPSVRAALYTPSALQGARYNPIEVGEGRLDVAMTTPAYTAWMAMHGAGIYERAYPGLRAIANYPHRDLIVFMVDASIGVRTLRELAEARYPLKVVTGRKVGDEEDILTFVVREILERHGLSYEGIEEWGGQVIFGGPTHIGGQLMVDGTADGLFQEAQMVSVWHDIANARDVVCLAVDERAMTELTERLGAPPAEIPVGHYRGVTSAVPTADFSGWLVFCREELDSEQAYALAQACDRVIPTIEGIDSVRGTMEMPIEPRSLFTSTAIPLHEGAAAYARERGYLPNAT